MIPYRIQKIENAVCFFASEYHKRTRQHLYSTYLYKLVAYLDFISIKENGRPSLGLTYKAMKMGPVPMELYNNEIESCCFKKTLVNKDKNTYWYIPNGEPNIDYFSEWELDEMYRLIEIFADRSVDTNAVIDSIHQDILAWKRTYRENPNSIIKYELEFTGDIYTKDKEKLKIEEENLIQYLAFQKNLK